MEDTSSDYTIKMILLNDPCYTWHNGNNACNWFRGASLRVKQCKEGSGMSYIDMLTVLMVTDGLCIGYSVTWYGSIITTNNNHYTEVKCKDGVIPITLPTFRHNIAIFVEIM